MSKRVVIWLRALSKGTKSRPWLIWTALAGVFLYLSARSSGPAQGCTWLQVIDIAGDLAILLCVAMLAREPEPDNPEYLSEREGLRTAIVNIFGLSIVCAMTAMKAWPDIKNTCLSLHAFYYHGLRTPSPFPSNLTQSACVAGFAAFAFTCSLVAYSVAISRRRSGGASTGTIVTLYGNLWTGFANTALQVIYLCYLRSSKGFAETSAKVLAQTDPVVYNWVVLFMMGTLALLIISKSGKEALIALRQIMGKRAERSLEDLIGRSIKSIACFGYVRDLRVNYTSAVRAVLKAQIDLTDPLALKNANADLKVQLDDCIDYWTSYCETSTELTTIHPIVEWTHNGLPVTGLGNSLSHLMLKRDARVILPLIHEGTDYTVDINPEVLLKNKGMVVEHPVFVRTAPLRDGWAKAKNDQIEAWRGIDQALRNSGCEVVYFGLVEIPLGIHLGYLAGSWRHVELYQRDHGPKAWDLPDGPESGDDLFVSLDYSEDWDETGEGRIVVLVEVSASIDLTDISAVIPTYSALFRIKVDSPDREVMSARSQIYDVGRAFKRALDVIRKLPSRREIHLFCAIPCGVSFNLGQQINPNMDPPIQTYHYKWSESPRYTRAILIP